jgi:hypothetical protein
MLHFLSQLNHFPSGRKDGRIALLLPELDIEFAVGILPDDESRRPP